MGLDPKLPLPWSTDLGNVWREGERDGCTMHYAALPMRCDAKCDAAAYDKGIKSHPMLFVCRCFLCLRRAKKSKRGVVVEVVDVVAARMSDMWLLRGTVQ